MKLHHVKSINKTIILPSENAKLAINIRSLTSCDTVRTRNKSYSHSFLFLFSKSNFIVF